ncbi:uncharacterized protein LOC127778903 isoform X2 [Oryza glaberrima]|uniref:uncharacterized protein LOC127778903 isoform X2 n=1 Tax=Oryza glaberrima TaxID=4538 RepID=UPI00224C0FC9|nr:uncharacterized protein LOC127778903 isoform X2 [Oryza glaberrima]
MKKKVESKHNNKDMKMALKHDIPLEVLQEGIPTALRGAPDNEVQAGRVIRVSSATGLKEALQQAGPGAPLKVYVVSYLPPSTAAQIREMTTTTRGGKEAQEKKPSASATIAMAQPQQDQDKAASATIAKAQPQQDQASATIAKAQPQEQEKAADKLSSSATIAKAQPQPHDQETATAPPQPTKSLSAPFKFKVKLRSHSKEDDKLKNAGSNAQEKIPTTVKFKVDSPNPNASIGEEEEKGNIAGFIIANIHVLEAKEMAMMAMEGDMSVLEELQKRISSSPDLSPHDVQVQLPTTANNLGTDKGKNILFSLKKRYLLAHLQAGHSRMATNILKYVDLAQYNSFIEEADPEKASKAMDAVKAQYELEYPGKHSPGWMAKQVLGVAAHMYWEKKKAKIMGEDGLWAADKTTVLTRLKKQSKKMQRLANKRSLIGAALADFRAV